MEKIYIRPNDIQTLFGISRSTLYNLAKNPNFPKPLKPSTKITLWKVTELESYFKEFCS